MRLSGWAPATGAPAVTPTLIVTMPPSTRACGARRSATARRARSATCAALAASAPGMMIENSSPP
jgi:hypothetical protein